MAANSTENTVISVTHLELCDFLQQCRQKRLEGKFKSLDEYLQKKIKCDADILKNALRRFKTSYKQKWNAAGRSEITFRSNPVKFLKGKICVRISRRIKGNFGRPKKSFPELSERSMRRETEGIRKDAPLNKLLYATQMSLRSSGNVAASKIVKKISFSPEIPGQIEKALKTVDETASASRLSPQKALSLLVNANLTSAQYTMIREASKDVYPCYTLVQRTKHECYPEKESITVTETCSEVKLQSLLDLTASKLCLYLDEVLQTCTSEEKTSLELISKWGCDGSRQKQYHQKFSDGSDNDAHSFQSFLVPVRLISNANEKPKTIWHNPVPSSPRYCRPVRLRFIKETPEVTREEIAYIEEQIAHLEETILSSNEETRIKPTLLLTMVDGKVCNAAENITWTLKCFLCGLSSAYFDDPLKRRLAFLHALKYGLQILHARLRFVDFFVELSSKIPIEKWKAETKEEKIAVKAKKTQVVEDFKRETRLLLNVVVQGAGTSITGNVSRRFFSDTELASRITGVDEALLAKCNTILQTIASGFPVDKVKFSEFTSDTVKYYIKLYNWYPMSPTVHKVLTHGAEIISHFTVPIGALSEEASEARNKHCRKYRENFARKTSRIGCNRDVFNRLILTSDPLISSERPKPKKSSKAFSKEVLELLETED